MVALWMIIGLMVATVSVSTLGAGFSVFGLSQLFSGAAIAVIAMAASLEFAKFVLAAYLHQTWPRQKLIFKSYLSSAVVILSFITSMGIFGFLSNAYQSASSVLDAATIKLGSLKGELARNEQEVARINKAIDEIPANRITKKMAARASNEPALKELKEKADAINTEVTASDLKIVEVKQKVGPLIYIARAFAMDIDQVVKYLILVLVLVFDPLAICLVIATSQALESRRRTATVAASASATVSAPSTVAAPASEAAQQVVQMRFVEKLPSDKTGS
jgi:hypothetical protein